MSSSVGRAEHNSLHDSVGIYYSWAEDSLIYSYQAGRRNLDLALDRITENTPDSVRASLLQFYGSLLWAHSDYPAARRLLLESVKFSTQLPAVQASAFNTLGLSYYYTADYDVAVVYLQASLAEYLHEEDSSEISRVMNNLGLVYQAVGRFDSATYYIVQGLKFKIRYSGLTDQYYATGNSLNLHRNEAIVKSLIPAQNKQILEARLLNDSITLSRSYQKIGTLFLLIQQVDSGLYYLHQAALTNENLRLNGRLGLDYVDLGDAVLLLGDTVQALSYYQNSYGYLKGEKMYPTMGSALQKIATLQTAQSRTDAALLTYGQLFTMSDTLGHRALVAKTLVGVARVYMDRNELDTVRNIAYRSLRLSELIGSFTWTMEAKKLLSDFYRANKQYDSALHYFESYQQMSRLENDAKILRQVEEFEAQYELATKNQEIEGLQNRETISIRIADQRRLALVIISVLLIISLMIAFRLRKQHINIKKLNFRISEKSDQNEVLLKEIHHRVKNNLQMVSSLMSMQKRQISDAEMLTLFQQTQSRVQTISLIHDHLYRYNQYATVNTGHFIKDLITMLTNSYEHLAIPHINYQLGDYELDIDLATSLGLIINELVTNSFKYAFVDHQHPELNINCSVDNDKLSLKVSDNGHSKQPFQKGFGWKIIDACVEGNSGTSSIEIAEGYYVNVTFQLNSINK